MKAVVQRVQRSSVEVDGRIVGEIGPGLNVLLGVAEGDGEKDAEYLARKIARLRIFEDEAGKMNRAVGEIDGSILVVSQFTLLAETRKGNRPSFTLAAEPQEAERLYQYFCSLLEEADIPVETGVFAAEMKVAIVNDGPVTIIIDSKEQ